MSIALLGQVYDEARRLAIAGAVVAPGDFRLKKLIAPLEQAGAKAPVFAKAAEAVKAVVESNDKTSAGALLDLTTLVSAVLYTQGETGAAGKLEPIETTDLGTPTSQASARVLKPLLEALTSTGSGRLELIRDAFERGAFRDLRLVKPALGALDDGYSEIADLVADKILPIYGKAILPELRGKFDMNGKGGHSRRLTLMHALDPAGTRDLVKQALESGSKEVKVAAIECLGADDLSYLLEQAKARAQEVRQAAYRALATVHHDDAVAELLKVAGGRDLDLAAEPLRASRNPKVLAFLISEIDRELTALGGLKDRKEIGAKGIRIRSLLTTLTGRDDPDTEACLTRLFKDRNSIAKARGEGVSGSDLNAMIVRLMQDGSKRLQKLLADSHVEFGPVELPSAFVAAQAAYPVDKVFAMFSPYLTAAVDEKKKREPEYLKRDAIISAIAGRFNYWRGRLGHQSKPMDPRWLDVAVALKHLGLVQQLARPGHTGANAFLTETFAESFKTAKSLDQLHEVVSAMVAAEHPEAAQGFLAAYEKHGSTAAYYVSWFAQLAAELPKSALPKLEALLPKLPDRAADALLGYVEQLRQKA